MSISPRKPAIVKSMLNRPKSSSKSSEPQADAAKRGRLDSSMLMPASRCSGPRWMSSDAVPRISNWPSLLTKPPTSTVSALKKFSRPLNSSLKTSLTMLTRPPKSMSKASSLMRPLRPRSNSVLPAMVWPPDSVV